MLKKIFGLIILGLVILGSVFGYKYYQDTYVGVVAYAKIPNEVPKKTYFKHGYSYDYNLNFVKENGTAQKTDFGVNNGNPLTPNTYLKVKISKKRVLDMSNVPESSIPNNILSKLTN
ncbi:YxeA family protein [Lactococcus garvieae]|nr:YxeA family protein [Lactococcus garvieae]